MARLPRIHLSTFVLGSFVAGLCMWRNFVVQRLRVPEFFGERDPRALTDFYEAHGWPFHWYHSGLVEYQYWYKSPGVSFLELFLSVVVCLLIVLLSGVIIEVIVRYTENSPSKQCKTSGYRVPYKNDDTSQSSR